MVIIDGLVEKITVRRGKEKVTITKKKYKAPAAAAPDDKTSGTPASDTPQ